MELSTKEVKYPIVTLKSYDDWNDFYENLEKLCRSMRYWDIVDPDLPDLDSDILVKPAVLTPEQSLDYVLSKIQSRTGPSTAVSSETPETSDTTPSRPAMSVADAINLRQFMMAQENAEYRTFQASRMIQLSRVPSGFGFWTPIYRATHPLAVSATGLTAIHQHGIVPDPM
ncbi:hypothetical protein E4U40_005183 [Claviceps sp. LM458 group G5]|nr:hypothetical protein E4U40_005183 [Claviceps sp. LM458 group G5]